MPLCDKRCLHPFLADQSFIGAPFRQQRPRLSGAAKRHLSIMLCTSKEAAENRICLQRPVKIPGKLTRHRCHFVALGAPHPFLAHQSFTGAPLRRQLPRVNGAANRRPCVMHRTFKEAAVGSKCLQRPVKTLGNLTRNICHFVTDVACTRFWLIRASFVPLCSGSYQA